MKSLVSILAGLLLTVAAIAQKYEPTANWPYLYPDFMDGELLLMNKAPNRAKFNIHLNLSKLHYIDRKGKIKEVDTWGVTGLVIGEDTFRFVGGKMLKVMAEAEGGVVVREPRPNYSAIVKNDGAMGTTGLNSTTTKTFLYNENAINQYNGYLLTDDYKELHAMKDQSERLPVNSSLFLVIGNEQIPANRKSVSDLPGIDKKAFSKFLKSEKIKWNDVEDLVKVLDYITAR
jgi:hypothetical protein